MRAHLKHFQRTFSEPPLESDIILKVVVTNEGINPDELKGLELVQTTYFPFNGLFDRRKAREDAERWAKYLHGEVLYLQNKGETYQAFIYRKKRSSKLVNFWPNESEYHNSFRKLLLDSFVIEILMYHRQLMLSFLFNQLVLPRNIGF